MHLGATFFICSCWLFVKMVIRRWILQMSATTSCHDWTVCQSYIAARSVQHFSVSLNFCSALTKWACGSQNQHYLDLLPTIWTEIPKNKRMTAGTDQVRIKITVALALIWYLRRRCLELNDSLWVKSLGVWHCHNHCAGIEMCYLRVLVPEFLALFYICMSAMKWHRQTTSSGPLCWSYADFMCALFWLLYVRKYLVNVALSDFCRFSKIHLMYLESFISHRIVRGIKYKGLVI